MHVRIRPRYFIPDRDATPEAVYRDRRRLIKGLGLGGIAVALSRSSLLAHSGGGEKTPDPAPAAGATPAATPPPDEATRPAAGAPAPELYPAKRNPKYTLDRPLTAPEVAARHNIFDEFAGEHEGVWKAARDFRVDPWKVHIGGAVEKAFALDAAELIRKMPLEERVYRHRCVETWAMAVPWTGFPLEALVKLAKPLAAARFLRMVSFARPADLPGWYASRRVFPYYEALSLKEASNELTLVVTGIYGHPTPMQHGAPLRLVVPWKYGFKSIKSIVAFQFTRERPGTFWNELAPHLYAFESNVDPKSNEPWPQNKETMLGTDEERPTQPYNGYAAKVAGLYA